MVRVRVGLGLLCLALPLCVGCGSSVSASNTEAKYAPRLKAVEVDVVPVRRQAVSTEVEFTGNLLPRRMTQIVSEVEGVVRDVPKVGTEFNVVVEGKQISERLGITYGQSVKQGDVLLEIDTTDAEIALRIAEAKLSKSKAELAKLKSWNRPEEVQRLTALRDEAKARYSQAHSEHRRKEQLAKRNVVTQTDIENAAMGAATSRAALLAAEAVLKQAHAGPTTEEIVIHQALIAEAEAEVESAKRSITKSTIRAPYDGVVTAFSVEVGGRVSPNGEPLVELMDLRFLVAEIAIPETYIGRVQVRDSAMVEAAGASQPVPGLVIAINDTVDPQTRTFAVRVAIDNEARKFKAGQFATVRLQMGGVEAESLAIPSSSIFFREGQPHVYVLETDLVESRQVAVGVADAGMTEILDGLHEGQQVVVDDPSLLSDGMRASVRSGTSHPTTD